MRLAVRGAEPVRVAALEWLDPIYVAGHWTPQMIEYAGGLDVLGMPGEHSERRSWEEVAAARPEVVVVMPCGYDAERAAEEAYEYARRARRRSAPAAWSPSTPPPTSPAPARGWSTASSCSRHVLHPDRLPEAPPGLGRDRALDGELRGGVGDRRHHGGDRDHRAREHGRDRASAAGVAIASTASAASTPPTRPPRWPPIEMLKPGKNVITRLMTGSARGPRP